MDRFSLPLLGFAKRLIALELSGPESTKSASQRAISSFEKLRSQIITLMGSGGFQALLTRAIALAQSDVEWLRQVHVNADGMIETPLQVQPPISTEQMTEGSAIVLAHFLGLLVTFVGVRIMVNIVRETWPEISVDESELFIKGSSYEE